MSKFVDFVRSYRTQGAVLALSALGSFSVFADDVAAYTPGSAVINKSMLDPIVQSITSTLGVVATSAFLILGFGVSLYIGFRVVKSLFKTATS